MSFFCFCTFVCFVIRTLGFRKFAEQNSPSMKHFFPAVIFLFLFNASEAIAQSSPKEAQWLAPACKPKTYGLHNSKGEVAAEAKFDMLEEADGKGWIAFSGGKYGVINSSGNWIIKPNYEIIVQFLNGKAVAGKKSKPKHTSQSDEPFGDPSAYYSEEEPYSDSVMYYGIVDASGVWITEPSFEFIRLGEDGTAQYADHKNKIGFINTDGSVMIRAQYDYASRMDNGVAVIGEPDPNASTQISRYNRSRFRAGKYSVIDRSGNKLNAEAYEMIREFNDGRAAFNKGGIWKSGHYYSSDLRLVGGKWGFLDASGKEVIAPSYDYVYDFTNGKAKVRSGERVFWVDKDGKETDAPLPVKKETAFTVFCAPGFFGYIGLDGKFVIEPQYFAAKEFSEGLAAVMPLRASDMDCNNMPEVNSEEYEISHRGYSKMLGKLLNLDRDYGIDFETEMEAQMLYKADSMYAVAMQARRLYGYADKTGNMVLPAKYEVALPFHNGRAYVLFREKWGVIDTKGNWIFAPVLEWPDELSFINFDYGNDGRQYYNYNSDRSSGAFSFNEGVGCIYKYGYYGFIDSTGKIIAAPVYDEVKPFVNGLAAVRHNGYWGYIDKTGKEIIPMKYLSAGSFSPEGLACVGVAPEKSSGEETYEGYEDPFYGYIDKKGNWAIKPKFTEANDFSGGYAAVSTDYEKSGYIDKSGKFIIPPKYDYASNFEYGFALVRVSAHEPIYIDKAGRASKTFTYDHPPKDKSLPLTARMGANNYYGFVNERGEAVIPYEFSEVGDFSKVR
jgi:hypothetical protein